MTEATQAIVPTPPLTIIKIGKCTNVSGKSELTYHIGHPEDKSLHIRLYENSGGGCFSNEWIGLQAIIECFANAPEAFTPYAMFGLFKGKSVNTPAFIMAALVKEGLMHLDPLNPRWYLLADVNPFKSEMENLIAKNTSLKVTEKPKTRPMPPVIVVPVFRKKVKKT